MIAILPGQAETSADATQRIHPRPVDDGSL
jgi:hypothetical protein